MNRSKGISFCFLFTMCQLCLSSNILLLPLGMGSHNKMFFTLGKSLKDNGHDVWVLTRDVFEDLYAKAGIKSITFVEPPENDYFKRIDEMAAESADGSDAFERFMADEHLRKAEGRNCHMIFQNREIMKTIEDKKFDLVVWDGIFTLICQLMIPYKYDIPFITVHDFQVVTWVHGVTGMPSIEPDVESHLTNKMNFWERIENLGHWRNRYNDFFYDIYAEHMEQYCPPHKPKIHMRQLAQMSEMWLMTLETMCLDYPRVSAPNTQYIGAATYAPTQPLPDDLEDYISSAEHGVVVVSMGSMLSAQYMWKDLGGRLFQAFGRLPQKIIVQYRLDKVYGTVPPNAKLLKWLQQNDILAHPNVKLFITHGGNNGQNEAAIHGVPMLVIPVIADQYYNAKRIEAHHYGLWVKNKKTITADELYEMMSEIINNQTYAQNIKKCSSIIKDMPSGPERFVFWVNHILKFGGAHLRPPSLDMPLYEVLMLDILAYYLLQYLVAFHVALIVVYLMIKYLMKFNKAKRD